MGNLVFQATLGGQVNLVGPNTASTFNLNVPATSSTIATLTGTETFTNKTLTSPTLTTPVLGTPSSGTLTNCTGLPNAGLTNSSITIGGTAIALGASSSTITNDLSISGLTVGKGGGAVSTNTAVGASALGANTTGANNTAIGNSSASAITTGVENVAIGSLSLNTATTASYNTVMGLRSAYSSTSATENVAIGYYSLNASTTGSTNVAVGASSLRFNTTGSSNAAFGHQALLSNTTASNNTAVGYQALYSTTTAGFITALGYQAGYSATSGYSLYVGNQAGYNTTGAGNTFVGANSSSGFGAGYAVTTGGANTILGGYSGNQGGLDIRTASNYIVLSDGAGNPRQYMNGSGQASWGSPMIDGFLNLKWAGQSYIGMVYNNTDTFGSSANIRFKNNGTTVGDITSTTSATSYNTSSDYRLKHDVQPMVNALAKISQLKPVTYKWNIDASFGQGFIAHELQEVFPDAVHGEKDAVEEDGSIKPQGIDTSFLVATLAASIQELKTIVDAQAAEIAELKAKVA